MAQTAGIALFRIRDVPVRQSLTAHRAAEPQTQWQEPLLTSRANTNPISHSRPELTTRQPHGRVAHVRLDIVECVRVSLVTVARRLFNKARTAQIGVPVVIHEMVKA